MFRFLLDCKLSPIAFEGVIEVLYGNLSPSQAIELDLKYSLLSDDEKMDLVIKKLKIQ